MGGFFIHSLAVDAQRVSVTSFIVLSRTQCDILTGPGDWLRKKLQPSGIHVANAAFRRSAFALWDDNTDSTSLPLKSTKEE